MRAHSIEGAKSKMCPATGNTNYCIADACMKWEWRYKEVPSSSDSRFPQPPKKVITDKGYCNL